MILKYDDLNINVEIIGEGDNTTPIVFLHGFTGSGEDFNLISSILNCSKSILIDLPGHGKSDIPKELKYYSQDFLVELIEGVRVALKIEKFYLAGYSMGGRLAFSYAIKYSENLKGLICLSATAGIEDPKLRENRIEEDAIISDFIEVNEISDFIDFWLSRSLFTTLDRIPPEKYTELKERKLKNEPLGLSNMLKGFGTGTMKPLWSELGAIKCPVLLICGEADLKFRSINEKIAAQISNCELYKIKYCGHIVYEENPLETVLKIQDFINRIEGNK